MRSGKTHISRSPQKIAIYNTYVRSALVYNASTWMSNVTNNQLKIFHEQLRSALDIRYPKTIHNNELYSMTKTQEISVFIQKRRAHWGLFSYMTVPSKEFTIVSKSNR